MKVSAKGQVTIPKAYRERLNIEKGSRVTFRIRGHYLLVELETDVETDVKYLKEKKGKLGEERMDETGIREIVRDLLTQQFYAGGNKITDRIAKKEIEIRGSDAIVKKSIDILTQSARPWLSGDYIEALRNFSIDLDLDFSALITRYTEKVRNMEIGGMDMIKMMGGEVIFSMAMGEALSQFRSRVGDIVTENLVKEAKIRGFQKKLGVFRTEEEVTKSLADEYSILMNLRVLKEFAKINLRAIGLRDSNEITEEMFGGYEQMFLTETEKRRMQAKSKPKTGVIEIQDDPYDEDSAPEMPSFDF